MTRPLDPEFRQWVDAARAVDIGQFADDQNLKLTGTVERVGPCPSCGGRDRFAINTHKQTFLCRWCSRDGGDVIDLARLVLGCDFLAAVEHLTGRAPARGQGHSLSVEELAQREIERVAREVEREAASEVYREAERRRLLGLWRKAQGAPGSPVEDYLALRRVSLPHGAKLRFHPSARLYANGASGAEVVHEGPAMLGAILGTRGVFAGLHITWIDLSRPDGKVLVPHPETGEFLPAKKVRGSAKGGRVELRTHPAPRRLVIGEGTETTLSVRDDLIEAGRDLSDFAFWSGLNLGNIGGPAFDKMKHPTAKSDKGRAISIPGIVPSPGGIPVPDSVEEITILGDGDSDAFLSRVTHARASARWDRPGRTIRVAQAPEGTDFNSLRMNRS